jgi:hypothetical protein
MTHIRLRWVDASRADDRGLIAGPWMADTPFNRGTLESVLEARNYAHGPGAYWLEFQDLDVKSLQSQCSPPK